MKKFTTIIVQIITIVMITLLIFLPKKEFSANENRYLEKFPSVTLDKVLNGKIMSSITNYISDHLPLRETLLSFKTNVFKLIGVKRQNGIYYAEDYLIEEYKKPLNNEKIVRVINKFVNNNPNIKYDFMLVPTTAYILKNKLSDNLNYDEKETLDYFKNNLNANFIDVSKILLDNNKEYIYYRTDHHWTTRGANYAYLEYTKNINLVPFKYDFKVVSNDFYGTLYSKILDNSIKPDEIEMIIDDNSYEVEFKNEKVDSIYNPKYLKEKDKYSYFLDGNKPIMTITNKNGNDEILIIKDSYANSFIPLLLKHFYKVHVIDPRYYKNSISNYLKENNINHVLFLYNVGTIDSDIGILSINEE